jgi:hypothetical protein
MQQNATKCNTKPKKCRWGRQFRLPGSHETAFPRKFVAAAARPGPASQTLSFQPSAFTGVHRRPIWFFAKERTPCSATKPLEIVAPRKESEV